MGAGQTCGYTHMGIRERGNNIWTITGYWWDEYVLAFDEHGVLRHWTDKSEKHRDERLTARVARWPSGRDREPGLGLSRNLRTAPGIAALTGPQADELFLFALCASSIFVVPVQI